MFLFFQTGESPIHYCARAGNADIMLEIVKHLGPNRVQGAINKQAKVSFLASSLIVYFSFIKTI